MNQPPATPSSQSRRLAYQQEAAKPNASSAWVIRHPGGLYFERFGRDNKVLWTGTLADAKLFNATALSQAERYIERIKEKDSLYVGMKTIKIVLSQEEGR